MPRKKATKVKEQITFRFKKLKGGNQAIYLQMYKPGSDANHCYSYEHLHLFIIPETDKESKERNAHTMKVANMIKAQRLLELTNEKAGIKKDVASRTLLVDFMEHVKKDKAEKGRSKSNILTLNNVLLHLKAYKGTKVTMAQVDKKFCEGFVQYLSNCQTIGSKNPKPCQHKPKPMSSSTANLYFNTFVTVLNQAVREEIIDSNPTNKLDREQKKPIRVKSKGRGYLDIKEVELLAQTDCVYGDVKKAFMFSCFTGLRVSDIQDLRWQDVKDTAEGKVIDKQIIKTKTQLKVPLSDIAISWLPECEEPIADELVFDLPIYFTVNTTVQSWAKEAGITKHVTFHIARHTFATTLLTMGADIYTTSKLLGHQNLRTTQIYAEIIDKKKTDAVNLLNGIFNKEKGNQDNNGE